MGVVLAFLDCLVDVVLGDGFVFWAFEGGDVYCFDSWVGDFSFVDILGCLLGCEVEVGGDFGDAVFSCGYVVVVVSVDLFAFSSADAWAFWCVFSARIWDV